MNSYKIVLDKERELKFSNRAFLELEKRLGKSIVSIFTESAGEKPAVQQKNIMAQFSSAQFITDFIYCGLMHDAEITHEKVLDIVPVNQYMDIMTLALKVLPEEFGLTGKAGKKETQKKS